MAPSADTGRKRISGALGAGALLAGGLAYVGVRDPHSPDFGFPACPFKALTGWDCPGCGGLRMAHDLLHGDFAAAVVDNVFLLVGLPLLVAWFAVRWRQGKSPMNSSTLAAIVVATVAWTVVRNVPAFPLIPTVLDG